MSQGSVKRVPRTQSQPCLEKNPTLYTDVERHWSLQKVLNKCQVWIKAGTPSASLHFMSSQSIIAKRLSSEAGQRYSNIITHSSYRLTGKFPKIMYKRWSE